MTDPTIPTPWRISVDTGGTFTDAIAAAPDGSTRRAKVLSTGALRATIASIANRSSSHELTLHADWDVPEDFFAGFTLRLLKGHEHLITASHTTDSPTRTHTLRLSSPPAAQPHDLFELLTGEPAPVLAARLITRTPLNAAFPPLHLRLATTRGTNALLEHKGGPAALFLTQGFRDLLAIGTQQRPDLFALAPRKLPQLECTIVEIPGRLTATGDELAPLDVDAVRTHARALVSRNIRTAAICLMHAWVNPAHEQALAQLLRDEGFTHISISSHLSGLMRYLPRAQTTLANAYLSPVVEPFINGVAQSLSNADLRIMTSAGGLVSARDFHPKDSLLSGPAGGVVGAAAAARASGFPKILTFDMGGTSTDVARVDHDLEYVYEHRVGSAQILAPAVAVESVASGGGSVCWLDDTSGLLRVGPHSAGANPGPACYGAAGPLTITDVNLLLGRVAISRFQVPLDEPAARAAAAMLHAQLCARNSDTTTTLNQMLEALAAIANEQMAQAIRTVSAQRGYDPRDYALLAFGGAGGQHACAVADLLNISTIIIPKDVGLLSAKGLSVASIERFAQRQVLAPLATSELGVILEQLTDDATRALESEGAPRQQVVVARRILSLRLQGQEAAIQVELPDATNDLLAHASTEFTRLFTLSYAYPPPQRPIELESARVIARWTTTQPTPRATDLSSGQCLPAATPNPSSTSRSLSIHDRATLKPSDTIHAPAIIAESHATTLLDPGWTCTVDHTGALILTRDTTSPTSTHSTEAPRELLISRLTGIATDMGETLRRTSLSTNVKDRLDFSCAILDPEGELLVNAPHIPVHLGALGLCVRLVKQALNLRPNDSVVTNHPAFGGSHLPDVTVITPVFHNEKLLAFVASRAHHAEIGGTRPGSMPPGARTLIEEGVVIPPTYLVAQGQPKLDDFRNLLTTAPHPTRAIDENLADVQAQLAANARGQQALLTLAREHGPRLRAVMHEMRAHSESRTRAALARLGPADLSAREELDDGSIIQVALRDLTTNPTIDFTGSSPTHPFNLNAPLGVIRSAVMYVLRLLVNEPLPLNEGLLRAVNLVVPEGSFLNPRFDADPAHCPAVAGGNVETSQRVVDTLLKALRIAACSQGTMNNVVFGNARFGYYETICGGAGATASSPGESAVHTHMTNTRITDPEVLEHRYPVRLERFEIRTDSAGSGKNPGGQGVTREYTFLEPVSLSLLTQHRTTRPYAQQGAEPGAPGQQRLISPDGSIKSLPSTASEELPARTRLILQTPGGGGWGIPFTPAP